MKYRISTDIYIHLYKYYIKYLKYPPFSWAQITALFLTCRAIFRTEYSLMPDTTSSTITFKDSIVLSYLFYINCYIIVNAEVQWG